MTSLITRWRLEQGRALRNKILAHTVDFARVAVFQKDLDDNIQHHWPFRPGVDFRLLGEDDFCRSEIFRQKNRRERFLARLGDGHNCYGFVSNGGEVRSDLWSSCGSNGVSVAPFEAGLRCRIGARTAYIWDCRTADSHRRQGLYREGLERLQNLSSTSGAESAVIVCRTGNLASEKGILAAGFTQECAVMIVKLMNRPGLIFTGDRVRLVTTNYLYSFEDRGR